MNLLFDFMDQNVQIIYAIILIILVIFLFLSYRWLKSKKSSSTIFIIVLFLLFALAYTLRLILIINIIPAQNIAISILQSFYVGFGALQFNGLDVPLDGQMELSFSIITPIYYSVSLLLATVFVTSISDAFFYEKFSKIRLAIIPKFNKNIYIFTSTSEDSLNLANSINIKDKHALIIFYGPDIAPFDRKDKTCSEIFDRKYLYISDNNNGYTYIDAFKKCHIRFMYKNKKENVKFNNKKLCLFALELNEELKPNDDMNVGFIFKEYESVISKLNKKSLRLIPQYYLLVGKNINYQAYQEKINRINNGIDGIKPKIYILNEADITVKSLNEKIEFINNYNDESKQIAIKKAAIIGFGELGQNVCDMLYSSQFLIDDDYKATSFFAEVYDKRINGNEMVSSDSIKEYYMNHAYYDFIFDNKKPNKRYLRRYALDVILYLENVIVDNLINKNDEKLVFSDKFIDILNVDINKVDYNNENKNYDIDYHINLLEEFINKLINTNDLDQYFNKEAKDILTPYNDNKILDFINDINCPVVNFKSVDKIDNFYHMLDLNSGTDGISDIIVLSTGSDDANISYLNYVLADIKREYDRMPSNKFDRQIIAVNIRNSNNNYLANIFKDEFIELKSTIFYNEKINVYVIMFGSSDEIYSMKSILSTVEDITKYDESIKKIIKNTAHFDEIEYNYSYNKLYDKYTEDVEFKKSNDKFVDCCNAILNGKIIDLMEFANNVKTINNIDDLIEAQKLWNHNNLFDMESNVAAKNFYLKYKSIKDYKAAILLEHYRWSRFYISRGWRFGKKSKQNKIHNCLTSLYNIDKEIRAYDMINVIKALKRINDKN